MILRWHYTKNPKSMNWDNEDFSKAMKLKGISKKALDLVRAEIAPLPSASTLIEKFSFMHIVPQRIQPAITYLRELMPKLPPKETLACLTFDETCLSDAPEIDKRLDWLMVGQKAQVFAANSILGNWFMPVYSKSDTQCLKWGVRCAPWGALGPWMVLWGEGGVCSPLY